MKAPSHGRFKINSDGCSPVDWLSWGNYQHGDTSEGLELI